MADRQKTEGYKNRKVNVEIKGGNYQSSNQMSK